MSDRDPDRDEDRPGGALERPTPLPPPEQRRIVLRGELGGPGGCLVAALLLLVAVAVLGVLAVVGLVAFTVAAWIAAGALLVALVGALLGGARGGLGRKR